MNDEKELEPPSKRRGQPEKEPAPQEPMPMILRLRPTGGLLMAGYAREGEEVFK